MKIRWIANEYPTEVPVTQVYGIVFDQHGRIFVQNDSGRYNIPGGKPEANETPEETVRRECLEESQLVVKDLQYLGYCRVEDETDPRSPYAQLRYIAQLDTVRKNAPDPATNRVYRRELLSSTEAIRKLDWGPHGMQQISAAVEAAVANFGVRPDKNEQEVIPDNGDACP